MDRPLIGTANIIRRSCEDGINRVLLHLRKGKHAHGLWGFPGGHLELWEEPDEAVRRETTEEAGDELKTNKPKFWTIANTMYKDEGKHYVCLFFRCGWHGGEAKVMEPDKCEKWEWFAWDELPENIMPGIKNLKDREMDPFEDYCPFYYKGKIDG
jgi:8-oxo-dGTP diphosphatase